MEEEKEQRKPGSLSCFDCTCEAGMPGFAYSLVLLR